MSNNEQKKEAQKPQEALKGEKKLKIRAVSLNIKAITPVVLLQRNKLLKAY